MTRFSILQRVGCWSVAVLMLVAIGGCNSSEANNTSAKNDEKKEEPKEEKKHVHAPHGPNGGHFVELGEDSYHAEWMFDDETNETTVIMFDDKMKNEVEIATEKLTVKSEIEGGKAREFFLVAKKSDESSEKASHFTLVDATLVERFKMDTGVVNTLQANIEGKDFKATLERQTCQH